MLRVDIENNKRESDETRNIYNNYVQFGKKQCQITRPDTFSQMYDKVKS